MADSSTKTLSVVMLDGETEEKAAARHLLQPEVGNALTIYENTQLFGRSDLPALIEALEDQSRAVHSGNLKRAESMLITQAHTLDALFNNLARQFARASSVDLADRYMRLALRAQNQCRMTAETLANIKNPPIVYAKQANIANGPQQVNNGVMSTPTSAAHAEEKQIGQNELLEAMPSEQLDTRAPGSASRADSSMATLGEIDRPSYSDR